MESCTLPLAETSYTAKPKKPFNIKLPKMFQKWFRKPYDKFLISLLSHSSLLTSLTAEEIQASLISSITKPLDWLVWLNAEDRATFRKLKDLYMPHVTNARFVFALLSINDRLATLKLPLSIRDSSDSLKGHDGILPLSLPAGSVITIPKARRRHESYMINGIELLTENDS